MLAPRQAARVRPPGGEWREAKRREFWEELFNNQEIEPKDIPDLYRRAVRQLLDWTGPVDAVYKAIQSLVHVPCTLLEYTVQSVTEGIDALGEVSVRVRVTQPERAKRDRFSDLTR